VGLLHRERQSPPDRVCENGGRGKVRGVTEKGVRRMELKRGNLCVLKRPLADFIVVVQWVDGEDVSVRYLDSPRGESFNVVKKEELVKLSEEQERLLPKDFLSAIERQRQIVFSPKRTLQNVAELLKKVDIETQAEIFKILLEDDKSDEGGDRNGDRNGVGNGV
jgi:hypothetical protein